MRFVLLILMIGLAASGCRINPRAEREIALLRAEILDLEDQYYLLKSQRDTAVTRLRDCQGDDFNAANFADVNLLDGQCLGCETGDIVYDDDLAPQSSAPTKLRSNDNINSKSRLESEPSLEEVLPDSTSNPPNGNSISRVVINRQLSRGQDLDGQPGHEGLSLLIQPTDRAGRVQRVPGRLTVRIVEKNSVVSDRQIGLWEFSRQETESFLVRDGVPDQGILLHLPWDKQLPGTRRVNVMVNMMTADNRNLQSSLALTIDPPPNNYSPNDPLVVAWLEQDKSWPDFDGYDGGQISDDALELPIQSARSDIDPETPQWRPVR